MAFITRTAPLFFTARRSNSCITKRLSAGPQDAPSSGLFGDYHYLRFARVIPFEISAGCFRPAFKLLLEQSRFLASPASLSRATSGSRDRHHLWQTPVNSFHSLRPPDQPLFGILRLLPSSRQFIHFQSRCYYDAPFACWVKISLPLWFCDAVGFVGFRA